MNDRTPRREWCLVPNLIPKAAIDLQEIASRNETARQIITGFAIDMPTMAEVWRHLQHALHDIPVLIAEIGRLSADLRETRLDRANLLAAARATIAAQSDGEPDPLFYIRDELAAQDTGLPSLREEA
jgi:hypothetical protein